MDNKAILEVDISAMGAGGIITIDSTKRYDEVIFTGTVALTSIISVVYSAGPAVGDQVIVRNKASITTTIGVIDLFGSIIHRSALSLPFIANAIYATSGWSVVVSVSDILPDRISTWALQDSSVTTPKIADDAVTTVKVLDFNITTNKLANLAVIEQKIADLAVSTNKIQDNAVTTQKVLNKNITLGKIEDIPNNTILANISGVSNSPAAVPASALLSAIGVVSSQSFEYLIASDGQSTITDSNLIGGVLLSVSREAQPLTLTDVRGAGTTQVSFNTVSGTLTFINGDSANNAAGQVIFVVIKK